MRPKKNQVLVLKSTRLHDEKQNRDLTFLVKEDNWEAFKRSNSFVHRVSLATKILDISGTELKNEYKNNTNVQFKIEIDQVTI